MYVLIYPFKWHTFFRPDGLRSWRKILETCNTERSRSPNYPDNLQKTHVRAHTSTDPRVPYKLPLNTSCQNTGSHFFRWNILTLSKLLESCRWVLRQETDVLRTHKINKSHSLTEIAVRTSPLIINAWEQGVARCHEHFTSRSVSSSDSKGTVPTPF